MKLSNILLLTIGIDNPDKEAIDIWSAFSKTKLSSVCFKIDQYAQKLCPQGHRAEIFSNFGLFYYVAGCTNFVSIQPKLVAKLRPFFRG